MGVVCVLYIFSGLITVIVEFIKRKTPFQNLNPDFIVTFLHYDCGYVVFNVQHEKAE